MAYSLVSSITGIVSIYRPNTNPNTAAALINSTKSGFRFLTYSTNCRIFGGPYYYATSRATTPGAPPSPPDSDPPAGQNPNSSPSGTTISPLSLSLSIYLLLQFCFF